MLFWVENGYGSGVHPLYAVVKSASLFTVVKIATSSIFPLKNATDAQ